MGSYDQYDLAEEVRFTIPVDLKSTWDRYRDTAKQIAFLILRKWAPRLEAYLQAVDKRRAPRRYAQWRDGQDKRWRARLPRKKERPAIMSDSKTLNQLQSRFFRLPLEVREEIYAYIFDGGTVKLDAREKVMNKVVRTTEPYRLSTLGPQPCLAVLQSCKRMWVSHILFFLSGKSSPLCVYRSNCLPFFMGRRYIEAAHLLYSRNTFIFPDLTTYLCFERLVPGCHWHRIQSLSFSWDYCETYYIFDYDIAPCPANKRTWEEVCRAVSQMEGLERVSVKLVETPLDPYGEDEILQPLGDIKRPIVLECFEFNERRALVGRCWCGCGRRAEDSHERAPTGATRTRAAPTSPIYSPTHSLAYSPTRNSAYSSSSEYGW